VLKGDQPGEEWAFDSGEQLLCVTRSVHLDEDIYGSDAGVFRADRFLAGSGDDKGHAGKKFMKNGKEVSNFMMPFGGGVSMVSSFIIIMLGSITR